MKKILRYYIPLVLYGNLFFYKINYAQSKFSTYL